MHGGTGQADQRPALRGLNGLRGVRGLAVLAVVAAALPIVVAGIRSAIDGWIPAGDVAYVSIRAADVFSSHPPLVGIHTTASAFGGEMVNHPGPIELYWLAPWIKVFGLGPGTALGTSFLNTVCVVAVAWLAYRRAGHLLSWPWPRWPPWPGRWEASGCWTPSRPTRPCSRSPCC